MKMRILTLFFAALALPAAGQENLTILKGGGLSLKLPGNWKVADRKPVGEDMLGAFQSGDNTSSLFVSAVKTEKEYSLPTVLDQVVTNFENGLIVNHIGKTTEGKLAGVFAVFCTLELDLPSATTKARKAFRFYLTVFEIGGVVYLIQGSVQSPVKKEREQEILAIIRSVEKAVN
jgi:hypothetical protein